MTRKFGLIKLLNIKHTAHPCLCLAKNRSLTFIDHFGYLSSGIRVDIDPNNAAHRRENSRYDRDTMISMTVKYRLREVKDQKQSVILLSRLFPFVTMVQSSDSG